MLKLYLILKRTSGELNLVIKNLFLAVRELETCATFADVGTGLKNSSQHWHKIILSTHTQLEEGTYVLFRSSNIRSQIVRYRSHQAITYASYTWIYEKNRAMAYWIVAVVNTSRISKPLICCCWSLWLHLPFFCNFTFSLAESNAVTPSWLKMPSKRIILFVTPVDCFAISSDICKDWGMFGASATNCFWLAHALWIRYHNCSKRSALLNSLFT